MATRKTKTRATARRVDVVEGPAADERMAGGVVFEDAGDDDLRPEDVAVGVVTDGPPPAANVTAVPVERYGSQTYFRCNLAYMLVVWLLLNEADGRFYLLAKDAAKSPPPEAAPYRLVAQLSDSGNVRLAPLKLMTLMGSRSEASESYERVCRAGVDRWVRARYDKEINGYKYVAVDADRYQAVWPDMTMWDLVMLGFKDRIIRNLEHPVVKKLAGEI